VTAEPAAIAHEIATAFGVLPVERALEWKPSSEAEVGQTEIQPQASAVRLKASTLSNCDRSCEVYRNVNAQFQGPRTG